MTWYQGWGFWYNSPDGSINTATQRVNIGDMGSTATTPPTVTSANSAISFSQFKNEQTPGTSPGDLSAKAAMNDTLTMYGLGSLATFAWNEYLKDIPVEQIMLDIRKTPEYKARFPAMAALAASGHAISESDYISYERSAGELMKAAGLPKGFYDQPSDFAAFLTNNIALPELQSRIDLAKQAVYTSDPATLSALKAYYGVNGGQSFIGDATAYFLDPKRALPAIQQQFIAAQEGGAATRTGYGSLSRAEAEGLATEGVTEEQAMQGFGSLATLQPLFANLPGDVNSAPTRQQGLEATFANNASAQRAIVAEQARRKAIFEAGGGFAETQKGMTGI